MKAHIRILVILVFALVLANCSSQDKFYSNALRSDVFVQLNDVDDYDFLWLFDNSRSMEDKRNYVKDNMQSFLNTLQGRKAIDFRMAMVTTDFFNEAGALVSSLGGLKVVDSNSANPASDFASILENVQDNPATSFWERGLESLETAVAQEGSLFMRDGVPLIVIILTDEDDYSCQDKCWGVEPENNPDWVPYTTQRYIDFFNNLGEGRVSIFPIIGTTESSCTVPSLGSRYMEVAEGSDGFGVSGSICLNELPDSYENIAKIIADRGVKFPLGEQASGKGIKVFVDSVEVPWSEDNGFVYDEEDNAIIFSGEWVPDNESVIEILYSQLTG